MILGGYREKDNREDEIKKGRKGGEKLRTGFCRPTGARIEEKATFLGQLLR